MSSRFSTNAPTTLVARLERKSGGAQCVDLVALGGNERAFAVDKHSLVTTADPRVAAAALRELDMHLTLLQASGGRPHEHVVRLLGYRLEGERLHLLHEFCAQGDLLAVLRREARMETAGFPTEMLATRSERSVRDIFAQTLWGVASLHRAGIAHLDLSLENVFLTADGQVRVGDLGLAERFQTCSSGRVVRQCPQSVAKLAYAAPEMHAAFAAGIPIDVTKADAWALGVILWHLWTKRPLFCTATRDDPLFHRMERDGSLEALEAADPELSAAPPALRDLLARLLTVDPLIRLSATEALRHPWIAGCPVKDMAKQPPTTAALATAPKPKLRRASSKTTPAVVASRRSLVSKPKTDDHQRAKKDPEVAEMRKERAAGKTHSSSSYGGEVIALEKTRVSIRGSVTSSAQGGSPMLVPFLR